MAVTITPYTDKWRQAVREFNARLRAGGLDGDMRFPEQSIPDRLADAEGHGVSQEYFLAVEENAVRGGFILAHQAFTFRGNQRRIAHYRLPLSESVVNTAYAGVAAQMLRTALEKQPLLFALGMGSLGRPLPQMLKAMGWSLSPVPFYFQVVHAFRFFRGMRVLRRPAARGLLMDAAAVTGAGWMGLRTIEFMRRGRLMPNVKTELVPDFSNWADQVWSDCRPLYQTVAVRDAATLNLLYPPEATQFLRLRVSRDGALAGWAVLLDTQMRSDKYFGDLRVGTIADCLSVPYQSPAVIQAAAQVLRDRGVDLIVSNQSHSAWCGALRGAGFIEGPSNFIFAASRALAQLMGPFSSNQSQIHINRGDGDGPIHL